MFNRRADHHLTRRSLLQASAGALLGAAVGEPAAAQRPGRSPPCDRVILFWNSGGMSQIDTFDPKPGRPVQGSFQPIETAVPGIVISEIFPRLAGQMKHITLVRSVVGTSADHAMATHHFQSSWALATGLSHDLATNRFILRETSGFGDLPVSIAHDGPGVGSLVQRCPASLSQEKLQTLERYGASAFGLAALLAARLVERGVRFVEISRGGFDTHIDNFPTLAAHAEVMDPALAALVADLAESGLLQKTMVVMLTEFGRTPRINSQAGRDHHAAVFTALLAGGGVPGGQAVGSSDADGMLPRDRPVTIPELCASIGFAPGMGVNTNAPMPLHRPLATAERPRPEIELFA